MAKLSEIEPELPRISTKKTQAELTLPVSILLSSTIVAVAIVLSALL